MADLQRGERLQIMVSDEELRSLENFRFENRMPSRAAAVRELLRRGLAAEGYLSGDGSKSPGYGIIDRRSDGHSDGG